MCEVASKTDQRWLPYERKTGKIVPKKGLSALCKHCIKAAITLMTSRLGVAAGGECLVATVQFASRSDWRWLLGTSNSGRGWWNLPNTPSGKTLITLAWCDEEVVIWLVFTKHLTAGKPWELLMIRFKHTKLDKFQTLIYAPNFITACSLIV